MRALLALCCAVAPALALVALAGAAARWRVSEAAREARAAARPRTGSD